MKIKISPSILAGDFANLGRDTKRISESGADFVHIDVMDGNFVPNLTIGPEVIKAIKPYSSIPFDVHLMIESPEIFVDDYINAGADIITFHLEASKDPHATISLIKSKGIKAGISLMPKTEAEDIFEFLESIDLVLIMTVEPGFGGQRFMENQLKKISKISKKAARLKKDIIISVDGGINDATARLAIENGANMLVSGSWLFKQPSIEKAVLDLKKIIC